MKRITDLSKLDLETNARGHLVLRGTVHARNAEAIRFTDRSSGFNFDTAWIPRSALRSHRTIEKGDPREGTLDFVEITLEPREIAGVLVAWIRTGPIPQGQRPW